MTKEVATEKIDPELIRVEMIFKMTKSFNIIIQVPKGYTKEKLDRIMNTPVKLSVTNSKNFTIYESSKFLFKNFITDKEGVFLFVIPNKAFFVRKENYTVSLSFLPDPWEASPKN